MARFPDGFPRKKCPVCKPPDSAVPQAEHIFQAPVFSFRPLTVMFCQ